MRSFICIAIVLFWLVGVQAATPPTIPQPLASVLRQIVPDMKKGEVANVLSKSYPNVQSDRGMAWSGQTGYVGFGLDERYTLQVSALHNSKQEAVVHPELLFYLFDNSKKVRIEIRRYQVVDQFSWADEKRANSEGSAAPERAAGPRLNKPVSSRD